VLVRSAPSICSELLPGLALTRVKSARSDRLVPTVESLEPQRLALTIIGNHGRNFRLVWSGGLVELLGYFGFSYGAARIALSRLCQGEHLERFKRGRLVFYRLTNEGEQIMAEGDRRIFSFGQELNDEQTWTVVWHAVPDGARLKRAALARRLRFLGFGSVQDGTWVAPHDREKEVVQLLAGLDLTDYAGVLLGRPAASIQFQSLIARAWDLADIDQRYERFIASFGRYTETDVQASQSPKDAFTVLTLMADAFKRFPSLDPELGSDVMQTKLRSRAVEIFHAGYEGLIEPAQHHFDEVAAAPA
jgi:phenylacetic acid degradation operon negative regulatory protein